MQAISVFVSYSHADEWLKDELIKHLAALKHREVISVWHDRMIPPGGIIDCEIDKQIRTAHVVLLLVSNDFIASDYCFNKEYAIASERREAGEAVIVPIIVRDCDWDAKRLKMFNALPPDGKAVTKDAGRREDAQQRDAAWLLVAQGLRTLIEDLKKKLAPPQLVAEYRDGLFQSERVKHPLMSRFDESLIYVDPDLYLEKGNRQITDITGYLENAKPVDAVVFAGPDQSGKSVIAKKIQELLTRESFPTVLLSAREIKNSDILGLVRRTMRNQLGTLDFPLSKTGVIIEDFDECNLPDRIKENIIEMLCHNTRQCILFAFSNAPCVLFTSKKLPDPKVFNIQPFTDDKLLRLVTKWKSVGLKESASPSEQDVLTAYNQMQMVFSQTEAPKTPCAAVLYLQLLETSSGPISPSLRILLATIP